MSWIVLLFSPVCPSRIVLEVSIADRLADSLLRFLSCGTFAFQMAESECYQIPESVAMPGGLFRFSCLQFHFE